MKGKCFLTIKKTSEKKCVRNNSLYFQFNTLLIKFDDGFCSSGKECQSHNLSPFGEVILMFDFSFY